MVTKKKVTEKEGTKQDNNNNSDNNYNQNNMISSNKNNHRSISKDKYILAGVFTLLIFILGLTLGFLLEDHRYNLIEEVNMKQDVKYGSLQLQFLFLNAFSNENNCPVLSTMAYIYQLH